MGMSVEWDNDAHTIIRVTVRHPWTWEDYDQMVDESMARIAGEPHPVDTIIDLRDGGARPPGPGGMYHFRRAWHSLPQNAGIIVNVGIGGLLRSLVMLFVRATGQDSVVAMTATIEEAHAVIARQQQQRQLATHVNEHHH